MRARVSFCSLKKTHERANGYHENTSSMLGRAFALDLVTQLDFFMLFVAEPLAFLYVSCGCSSMTVHMYMLL